MQIVQIGKIALYQSDVLNGFENIVHGFTTRMGGVSKGEYESLSMSPRRGDDISCVRENERILCTELGLGLDRLSSTRQEHTDNIEIIDAENIGIGVSSDWGKGVDACITLEKNVPILCYSADCVPILMYARDIEAIAAVHSGWKGSALAIGKKTVEKLIKMGAEPQNIFVAIGPSIGKCCYEVSEDVATRFSPEFYTSKGNGKYMLDLGMVNYSLIRECLVPKENISLSGICTSCNNDLFFSHRRQNGKSGTLGGIICMKE